LRVHDLQFYRHAALGGRLSVAESYLAGDWDCDDLPVLFRLFIRNARVGQQLDGGLARIGQWLAGAYHAWHANTRRGSRENIQAHYDVGNDFYRLFLDETLSYSCGLFDWPQATLEEASRAKLARVAQLLAVKPTDHVLEIGTGWGALAIYLVERFGCRVTTTTISPQQYALAKERVRASGLEDRITLRQDDYRDLRGEYDKLVSIEMVEAVGREWFDAYFQKCAALLKPGGKFVLQGIVIAEGEYASYLRSVDFIQRYVFPGGCLPSIGALADHGGRAGLWLTRLDEHGPHYAQTLQHWRQRFLAHRSEAAAMGYPERFLRMWNYYLSYCEAAFAERSVGLVQTVFEKPGREASS
jgi:cyclopropane-fatty-acyl-phospholipid synthase